MWGGGGGTGGSGGGGGFDPSLLAGYAPMGWVEDNYISKAFWTELFVIHGMETVYTSDDDGQTWTQDGEPTSIIFSPNEVPSEVIEDGETEGTKVKTVRTITSIEAKKGVWTNFYLSALGQNSSGGGGGGGGSSTLQGLLDVNIPASMTQANDGQVLMYNYTQNKWINGNLPATGVTSVGMTVPTGFSVSPATITNNGTFAITFASGYSLPLTADVSKGVTAYGWGNHALAGYATQAWVGQQGFALESNVYSKDDADAKFMTIAAFENLFNAIASDGSTKVSHPYAANVASIKALFGFWTDQYLSALGQNSGGGGGGGSSTLAGLNDVNLTNPSNGQILQYDGSHWVNANPPQTGVTSVAAGTGLTTNQTGGGAITSTGTISISPTYQTYISHGETAFNSLSDYLPLAGGTISGQIDGSINGMWYEGRDNALLRQNGGNSTGWAPVLSVKTYSGSWELGAISDSNDTKNKLILSYVTDSNYNNHINTFTDIYFPTTAGTLALTSDVANAVYDMATQTWVGQNYLGKNATAAAATKLATARTLWGQPFDGQANVSGTMTDVGEIHFSNNSTRIIDNSGVPGFGWGQTPTSNSSWGVYNHYANGYSLYIKTDGCVGIGTTTPGCKLDVDGDGRFFNMLYIRSSGTTEGGEISLQGGTGYNDIEIDNYSGYLRMFRSGGGNCEFQFNPDSRLVHINGGNGSTLRIGDGMLVWDNANNALKVIKSDGTAGNIYATGGVSALGMRAGVSAMDAMTFNYVTVNNQISIKNTIDNVDYTHTIAGNANGKLVITGDQGIVLNGAINTNGNNITTGNASIDAGEGWVKANRFYLDGSRYLYVSGSTLYYYNGSTTKQVAFTN